MTKLRHLRHHTISPATVVTVAGHTDSSGDDAVNDPLSLHRAQAVRQALSALLSRDGVRFQTEGYGSRRPLYSNDSDEGKHRNRRVTVTFPKPQPAPREPVATTSPGATGLPGRLEVPTDDGVDFYCACTDVSGVRVIALTPPHPVRMVRNPRCRRSE